MTSTRIRRKTTVNPVSSHGQGLSLLTGSRILAMTLMLTGGILLSGCQKKNDQPVATTRGRRRRCQRKTASRSPSNSTRIPIR